MKPAPLTIGLTGGIASGKSLISQEFTRLGVEVLDADQVSRQVVEPGQPALQEIANEFGDQVITQQGTLDRARMRQIVFSNPDRRARLEQITHPRIRAAIDQWRAHCGGPYIVLENAILIESGMHRRVDRVLVVDVPASLQRTRLAQRDNTDPELIERMLGAQLDREQRLAAADDVIDNSGSIDSALAQVHQLHKKYRELAAGVGPDSR